MKIGSFPSKNRAKVRLFNTSIKFNLGKNNIIEKRLTTENLIIMCNDYQIYRKTFSVTEFDI